MAAVRRLDRSHFPQQMRRRNHLLFPQPFLRRAAKILIEVVRQLPHPHSAAGGQFMGIELTSPRETAVQPLPPRLIQVTQKAHRDSVNRPDALGHNALASQQRQGMHSDCRQESCQPRSGC